jgi:hypothetical protein
MIDVQGSWQYNSIIRAAEVAVTKKLKNVDTLDTKGFPTDNIHYKAQGQVKIGTITAQRWLNMNYVYDHSVSVNRYNRMISAASLYSTQSKWSRLIDLSGKQITSNRCVSANDVVSSRSVYIVIQKEHGSEGLKIVKIGK